MYLLTRPELKFVTLHKEPFNHFTYPLLSLLLLKVNYLLTPAIGFPSLTVIKYSRYSSLIE